MPYPVPVDYDFSGLHGKTIKHTELTECGIKLIFTDDSFAVLEGGNGFNHLPEVSIIWNKDPDK